MQLDGLVLVKHTSVEPSWENQVHVSVPLLIVVLRGRKSVRSRGRVLHIDAGQAIFVAAGDYVMAEEVRHCRALLVFFEPDFVARFPQRMTPPERRRASATEQGSAAASAGR